MRVKAARQKLQIGSALCVVCVVERQVGHVSAWREEEDEVEESEEDEGVEDDDDEGEGGMCGVVLREIEVVGGALRVWSWSLEWCL